MKNKTFQVLNKHTFMNTTCILYEFRMNFFRMNCISKKIWSDILYFIYAAFQSKTDHFEYAKRVFLIIRNALNQNETNKTLHFDRVICYFEYSFRKFIRPSISFDAR